MICRKNITLHIETGNDIRFANYMFSISYFIHFTVYNLRQSENSQLHLVNTIECESAPKVTGVSSQLWESAQWFHSKAKINGVISF